MGAVAAIVNAATIANTEDCSDQLRDCNPNPPSAKPTSAMAVENAAIRRSYSKPPYVTNPATRKFLGDQEMKAVNSEDRKKNKYSTYFVSPPYTVRIADRCQSESLIAVILSNA